MLCFCTCRYCTLQFTLRAVEVAIKPVSNKATVQDKLPEELDAARLRDRDECEVMDEPPLPPPSRPAPLLAQLLERTRLATAAGPSTSTSALAEPGVSLKNVSNIAVPAPTPASAAKRVTHAEELASPKDCEEYGDEDVEPVDNAAFQSTIAALRSVALERRNHLLQLQSRLGTLVHER